MKHTRFGTPVLIAAVVAFGTSAGTAVAKPDGSKRAALRACMQEKGYPARGEGPRSAERRAAFKTCAAEAGIKRAKRGLGKRGARS